MLGAGGYFEDGGEEAEKSRTRGNVPRPYDGRFAFTFCSRGPGDNPLTLEDKRSDSLRASDECRLVTTSEGGRSVVETDQNALRRAPLPDDSLRVFRSDDDDGVLSLPAEHKSSARIFRIVADSRDIGDALDANALGAAVHETFHRLARAILSRRFRSPSRHSHAETLRRAATHVDYRPQVRCAFTCAGARASKVGGSDPALRERPVIFDTGVRLAVKIRACGLVSLSKRQWRRRSHGTKPATAETLHVATRMSCAPSGRANS